MKRFFTSDWHLNGTDVIKFCGRPFKNVQKMNDTLIRNVNERCGFGQNTKLADNAIVYYMDRLSKYNMRGRLELKEYIQKNLYHKWEELTVVDLLGLKTDNILYHVGDFFAYGNVKGTQCDKVDPRVFLDRIQCKVVLIEGNHDVNNKVKTDCKGLQLSMAYYPIVTVGHYPSWYNESQGIVKEHSIHICGHVHGLESGQWKYRYDSCNDILNINVCVDNWRMRPLEETQIVNYIDRVKRDLNFDPVRFTNKEFELDEQETEESTNG